MSTSGMNWCSIFCCCKYGKHKPWHGSLEYIPFLYGYNWTICHPFYRMHLRHWRHRLEVEYLNKDQLIPTLFAIVLVWIATKQTIGTNFKMSCLVIVTKRCHVIVLFHKSQCALRYLDLMSKIQNIHSHRSLGTCLTVMANEQNGDWPAPVSRVSVQPVIAWLKYEVARQWSHIVHRPRPHGNVTLPMRS